jgi:putative copper export protein
VIILGLLRGTVFGSIRDADALFGTAYGLTFLVALIVALATFVWGRFVIVPAARALATAPVNPDGTPTAELDAAVARAKRVTVLELIGFVVVFTCMILMRFGL